MQSTFSFKIIKKRNTNKKPQLLTNLYVCEIHPCQKTQYDFHQPNTVCG